jgi:hypothetical protein
VRLSDGARAHPDNASESHHHFLHNKTFSFKTQMQKPSSLSSPSTFPCILNSLLLLQMFGFPRPNRHHRIQAVFLSANGYGWTQASPPYWSVFAVLSNLFCLAFSIYITKKLKLNYLLLVFFFFLRYILWLLQVSIDMYGLCNISKFCLSYVKIKVEDLKFIFFLCWIPFKPFSTTETNGERLVFLFVSIFSYRSIRWP